MHKKEFLKLTRMLEDFIDSRIGAFMTYQPKPGDRVVSPLLVGEWEVTDADNLTTRVIDRHRDAVAYVLPDALVPVAQPLPPEPPVGSVVRAHGTLWTRYGSALMAWQTNASHSRSWADLATAPDLSPVVAVDDVADWLTDPDNDGRVIGVGQVIKDFRAEFGGRDK